jgi:hypothetical protein
MPCVPHKTKKLKCGPLPVKKCSLLSHFPGKFSTFCLPPPPTSWQKTAPNIGADIDILTGRGAHAAWEIDNDHCCSSFLFLSLFYLSGLFIYIFSRFFISNLTLIRITPFYFYPFLNRNLSFSS